MSGLPVQEETLQELHLTRPNTRSEGLNGAEAEFFIELDGGVVVRSYGQRQFPEFHGAKGFGGSLHEHAAEAMPLVAGQHADLRGVADTGGDFAGENAGDEIVAAGLVKNEGCAGHELAATGKQNDVLQKFQRAGAAAVLVVDLAVDVTGVSQINQLGARLEVAVIPAVEAHARGSAGFRFVQLLQIQKHELARIEVKSLVEQGRVNGAAEGHELRFDAREVRDGAHGVKHLFEQAAADGILRELGRDIQAADQAFLVFEDVKGIPGSNTVFVSDAAGQGVGVQEAFDELESAAVVPMQFVAPVARFFFEERLNLADGGLSQIDNIHG